MKLLLSLIVLLSLCLTFTIFPKFFIMLDCFILSHVLKTTPLPELNGTVNAPYSLGSIEYKLHGVNIEGVSLQEAWIRAQRLKHGGSRFELFTVGMVITATAKWKYAGKSWMNSFDSGDLLLESTVDTLKLIVELRPLRKTRITNLTLTQCNIKMGNVKIEINGKHDLLYRQLEKQASQRLREYISASACHGIAHVIDSQINSVLSQLNNAFASLQIYRDGYFVPQTLNWITAIAIFITLSLVGAFGIGFLLLLLAMFYINALVFGLSISKRFLSVYQEYKNRGRSVSTSYFDVNKTQHSFVLPITRGIRSALTKRHDHSSREGIQ